MGVVYTKRKKKKKTSQEEQTEPSRGFLYSTKEGRRTIGESKNLYEVNWPRRID